MVRILEKTNKFTPETFRELRNEYNIDTVRSEPTGGSSFGGTNPHKTYILDIKHATDFDEFLSELKWYGVLYGVENVSDDFATVHIQYSRYHKWG